MIINLIGLQGSGKSTVAEALSRAFGYPIITIGQFRNRKKNQHKSTNASEAFAWRDMASAVKKAGDCIVESTGLNHRLQPILNNIESLMTVKLMCSKKELFRRCERKDRHTEFFPYSFNDKWFIKNYWKKMRCLPADIAIRTDRCSFQKTINAIIRKYFDMEGK